MVRTLGLSFAALMSLSVFSVAPTPSEAAVYCRAVGIPRGCIARPVAPVGRAVMAPGVGARGVGVRPGTPMNRGGPVNRVGRR
ncbi:hypothetical protein [Microvirga antarctica]|uniref:hypothetical protein n=1 Tax=Microvirga antarctica TaxID=2819233 RepID=UPI001B30C42E|nr:hypothetical protein [Microvirga antarctica]